MSNEPPHEDAVAALEDLGLTESEARCFVALTQLPQGTAKEISEVADVPRARVYELADRLNDRGLVAVQDTTPKAFQAVSVETAIETLEQRHQDRLTAAAEALQNVETADEETQDEGVWTVTGREAILDVCARLIDQATDEIVIIHADERVTADEILDYLKDAHDRGVKIIAGSTIEELRERSREELPEATIFEPHMGWGDDPDARGVGRALMVDRDTLLASTVEEGPVPALNEETAVWGRNSGFDRVLRPVLEQRIEQVIDEDEE